MKGCPLGAVYESKAELLQGKLAYARQNEACVNPYLRDGQIRSRGTPADQKRCTKSLHLWDIENKVGQSEPEPMGAGRQFDPSIYSPLGADGADDGNGKDVLILLADGQGGWTEVSDGQTLPPSFTLKLEKGEGKKAFRVNNMLLMVDDASYELKRPYEISSADLGLVPGDHVLTAQMNYKPSDSGPKIYEHTVRVVVDVGNVSDEPEQQDGVPEPSPEIVEAEIEMELQKAREELEFLYEQIEIAGENEEEIGRLKQDMVNLQQALATCRQRKMGLLQRIRNLFNFQS